MSLLRIESLRVTYRTGGRALRAVDGVSLELARGETLGVVGESGCGKSTLARATLALTPFDSGRILFEDVDLTRASRSALTTLRRRAQIVFQDPLSSLNPRRTALELIAAPLDVHGLGTTVTRRERALDLMRQMGLRPEQGDRLAHEFSGGQRQRIGIARALALDPELLICDEPVSALDVSVRAQVLNLLVELQRTRGLAMLFISHDLSVIRYVADRVLVLYLGRAVETGPTDRVMTRARHPYTRALLAAVPSITRTGGGFEGRILAQGEVPDPVSPPSGCRYRTRCPDAQARCAVEEPALRQLDGVQVACHFA